MKKLMLVVVLVAAPMAVAQPLSVVTVNAPKVNFVFNPTGKVTVADFSAPIYKTGFLQSRNFKGVAPAPAGGKHIYEYRVDLRNVVGITVIPMITQLTVKFGNNVKLDFNGDGKLDDVFVITSGGLGNVGLVSAVRSGNDITFTFNGGVAGGSSPGNGDSSFFFGLVSNHARKTINVTAVASPAPNLTLQAWAPNYMFLPGGPAPSAAPE